jgi:hypothetical protein
MREPAVGDIINYKSSTIEKQYGIYTIIGEQIGETYTTYLAVLMFGEEQNRVWIFP